jgi:hypothetical protein
MLDIIRQVLDYRCQAGDERSPTIRTELIDQLVRVVDVRLLDPLEILLEGDEAVESARTLVRLRAEAWASVMLGPDDRAAVQMIARVISSLYPGDAPFAPPAEWWRTPLGQVAVRRIGHPSAQAVPYSVAGAMLGITRQGVHDLVTRHKLERHPEGGVTVESVRARASQGLPRHEGNDLCPAMRTCSLAETSRCVTSADLAPRSCSCTARARTS